MKGLKKIFKYIDTYYVLSEDKYKVPSIIKDNSGYVFSLVLSSTRFTLIKCIKLKLVEELGMDAISAEKVSEKFVESKYKIFCDFVVNM
jgi:hypothetical protein